MDRHNTSTDHGPLSSGDRKVINVYAHGGTTRDLNMSQRYDQHFDSQLEHSLDH